MTKRRKSSKCPEPINTLLDIAGAATLGLYVKHKVKKDFEKGCGEESAKAAAMVFGMGAMRRGSRGMYNLGGLMGLNSALKEIERKQISVRNYDNRSYVSRPVVQALPEIVKPAPNGLWKEYCEDGSSFGIYPENFNTADDYADALLQAKESKEATPVTDKPVSVSNQEEIQSSKKYRWRKYCADGFQYGICPEDYETADDYEDALLKAKDKYLHQEGNEMDTGSLSEDSQ